MMQLTFRLAAFATAGLDWREHVEVDASLKRPTDLQGFAGDASRAAQILGWKARTVMPDIALGGDGGGCAASIR